MQKKTPYKVCPECGANLDPGEACDECDTRRKAEAIRDAPALRPYQRIEAKVLATGNRWAIENFYATH